MQTDLFPESVRSLTKEEWLEEAREIAQTVIMLTGKVSADDLWERFPPPKSINPKIMGGVFKGLKFLRYRKSNRSECHHRPICEWTNA